MDERDDELRGVTGGWRHSDIIVIGPTAPITIFQNLNGHLSAGTLGNLTSQNIFNDLGGHNGTIDITNNYAGALTILFPYYGRINLPGAMATAVRVAMA